jgi:hypothetical protein
MTKTYAEKAIGELMQGGIIKIDDHEYIYQDGQFSTKAIRIENGIESEVWLGGMCADMSFEYFLQYCETKTFDDIVKDFPIKIPAKLR